MKEALESDLTKEWQAAADSEYLSLVENKIGCKWIFKMKYERYEGTKGYSQKYGVDYEETFAPVVRFSSIRALLAQNDMLVHQMDVQTAWYSGRGNIHATTRGIYTCMPTEPFIIRVETGTSMLEHYVQGLYGSNSADPCVFIKKENDRTTIVAV